MVGFEGINTLAQLLGGLNRAPGTLSVENVTESAAPAANSSKNQASFPTDQTDLSSLGALISKATSLSDVRTERVAQVQAAIASGSYNIAASAVADKIVQHLLS